MRLSSHGRSFDLCHDAFQVGFAVLGQRNDWRCLGGLAGLGRNWLSVSC